MLTDSTTTRYAVARKAKIISDGYTTPEQAQQQHRFVSETMESVGLKPDIDVVSVEVTTTISRPTVYTGPTEPDTTTPDQPDLTTGDETGQQAQDPSTTQG